MTAAIQEGALNLLSPTIDDLEQKINEIVVKGNIDFGVELYRQLQPDLQGRFMELLGQKDPLISGAVALKALTSAGETKV
ncbi:MAG: hypothetical protein S4CHLAM81_00380 [Chlamydiales bacterium]|nr:hypothetical protein [Chlamydiales bacterium]MCH9634840.1 hypothetical protein [Chlamydiales bacterium]MCH9703665.1 hypothetical protein [Chlamydiota bacterium]